MILFNAQNSHQSFRLTLKQFKALLILNYQQLKQSENKYLKALLEVYSEQDILNAINSTVIDNKFNIISPGNTRNNKILRYLEFGGPSVKALHLISNVKKSIEKGGKLK